MRVWTVTDNSIDTPDTCVFATRKEAMIEAGERTEVLEMVMDPDRDDALLLFGPDGLIVQVAEHTLGGE